MKRMKYTFVLIPLISLFFGCSDSASTMQPEKDNITVGAAGAVGKDLFFSDYLRCYDQMNAGVHSLNFDGTGLSFLYRAGLYSSPRGSLMVLASGNSIYLGDITGGVVKKVVSLPNPVLYVILSPDAKTILYATSDGSIDSINTYNLTTHQVITLVAPRAGMLASELPTFSDDSKQVLLNIGNPGPVGSASLWLVAADGTTEKLLATDQYDSSYTYKNVGFYQGFELSPDGTKCAYNRKTKETLCIQDIGSGVIEEVADTAHNLQWSPTGNYASFHRHYANYGDSNAIYNTHTKQIRYYPRDGGKFGDRVTFSQWSADEQSIYCLVYDYVDSLSRGITFIGKMNIATGSVEHLMEITNSVDLYRAKANGEH